MPFFTVFLLIFSSPSCHTIDVIAIPYHAQCFEHMIWTLFQSFQNDKISPWAKCLFSYLLPRNDIRANFRDFWKTFRDFWDFSLCGLGFLGSRPPFMTLLFAHVVNLHDLHLVSIYAQLIDSQPSDFHGLTWGSFTCISLPFETQGVFYTSQVGPPFISLIRRACETKGF